MAKLPIANQGRLGIIPPGLLMIRSVTAKSCRVWDLHGRDAPSAPVCLPCSLVVRSLGPDRIRRVPYEICVLQVLREKLRCKEIWVAGAQRYRNPEENVLQDFADQRATVVVRGRNRLHRVTRINDRRYAVGSKADVHLDEWPAAPPAGWNKIKRSMRPPARLASIALNIRFVCQPHTSCQ